MFYVRHTKLFGRILPLAAGRIGTMPGFLHTTQSLEDVGVTRIELCQLIRFELSIHFCSIKSKLDVSLCLF